MWIIQHLLMFTVYFLDVHQETKLNKFFFREILDSKVLAKYCIQPQLWFLKQKELQNTTYLIATRCSCSWSF